MTEPARSRPALLPPLLTIALLLLVRLLDPVPVERARLFFFDLCQRLSPRIADAELRPVVVVDVDEESLARFGQWPWPRDLLARLLDRIAESRPAAVGFDFLFAEPDRLGGDAAFAASLSRVPVVLATVPGTPGNVAAIDAAAAGRGTIGIVPERDGVVRRLPAIVRAGDEVVPGFAVEMVRVAAGAPAVAITREAVETGGFRIPIDAQGRAWIRYSRHAPWRFVSAADLLEGRATIAASRLVLLGATAAGLGDVVATPVEPAMAGIEIHAQAIENALSGTFLRRPAWATPLEVLLALLAGLAIAVAVRRSLLLLALLLLPALAFLAFTRGILLDPVWPTLTGLVAFTSAVAASLADERRRTLRLEGEMQAAREIQMAMLPDLRTAGGEGLEVAGALVPAKAVGGDFYDVVRLDDRRVFLIVGDVSGKGAPAALFMALVKTLCRSLALRGGSVEEIVRAADREIDAQNPAMMFATLVAAILDTRTGDLEWLSAGHEAPLVLEAGKSPRSLEIEAGPPLGALAGFPYASARTTLPPEATLVIVTDGIGDAANAAGARFTTARAGAALAGATGPDDAVRRLIDGVNAFVENAEPADDLTVLAVRVSGR